MVRSDDLDVQPQARQFLQQLGYQPRKGHQDIGIVPRALLQQNLLGKLVGKPVAAGKMHAEGVLGEQHAPGIQERQHAIRPMQHPGLHERQAHVAQVQCLLLTGRLDRHVQVEMLL